MSATKGDSTGGDHQGRLLVDVREAARMLSISVRTVWALAKAGELHPIPVARRLTRFDPADLRAYVASRKER